MQLKKWWLRRNWSAKSLQRSRISTQTPRWHPSIEMLEDRTLLTFPTPFNPTPWNLTGSVSPDLATGPQFYQISIPLSVDDLLRVKVTSALMQGQHVRLSLVDQTDNDLIDSDGPASPGADWIEQHLAGPVPTSPPNPPPPPSLSYYLEVLSPDGSFSGTVQLSGSLTPASLPYTPLPVWARPSTIVTGTFVTGSNNDLAVLNLGDSDPTDNVPSPENQPGLAIFQNVGDGTFNQVDQFPVTNLVTGTEGMVAGNFFSLSGPEDLAVLDTGTNTVDLWQNMDMGAGTFSANPVKTLPLSGTPVAIVSANPGNGTTVLAVATSVGIDIFTDVVTKQMNGSFTFTFTPSSLPPSPLSLPNGANPLALALGHFFTGTNGPDLAVLYVQNQNQPNQSYDIELFQNNGISGGAVQYVQAATTGLSNVAISASAMVSGNFTGGSLDDLAVSDEGNYLTQVVTGGVDVFLNEGNGLFTAEPTISVGNVPQNLIAGNFFGDGYDSIVTANADQNSESDLTVLRGNGSGKKFTITSTPYGGFRDLLDTSGKLLPAPLAVADFNSDQHLDFVVGGNYFDSNGSDVAVMLNDGIGNFLTPMQSSFPVGQSPYSIVTGDFNGDGNKDIVVADRRSNGFTVLLGNGQGGFEPGMTTLASDLTNTKAPPGSLIAPYGVAVGDFNGDGNLDLAFACFGTDDIQPTTQGNPPASQGNVTIFLGLGNGSFQYADTVPVGLGPYGIVAGDFGNGFTDLAVADFGDGEGSPVNGDPTYNSTEIDILLGDGTGQFTLAQTLTAGLSPIALTPVVDNSTGHVVELAAVNFNGSSVSIYSVSGTTPQFTPSAPIALNPTVASPPQKFPSTFPSSAVAFTQGDHFELAVADSGTSTVHLVNLKTDQLVQPPLDLTVGQFPGFNPLGIAAADFDGDTQMDLVTVNAGASGQGLSVSILRNNGDGTFQVVGGYDADITPEAVAIDDFNGDGLPDIAVANAGSDDVSVLLNQGNFSFINAALVSSAQLATPLLGELEGNGITDAVVLAADGSILFRPGVGTAGDTFGPAITVNDPKANRARSVALVQEGGQLAIAALDSKSPRIEFYAFDPNALGQFKLLSQQTILLPTGTSLFSLTPLSLTSGDLDNNALDDLVVTDLLVPNLAMTNGDPQAEVFIYVQSDSQSNVSFRQAGNPIAVGLNPGAVTIANLSGHTDGLQDIAVADRFTGEVSVIVNTGSNVFTNAGRFAAGVAPSGMIDPTFTGLDPSVVQSDLGTSSLAAGSFTGSTTDLIVTDPGFHDLALLKGDNSGGFLRPTTIVPQPTKPPQPPSLDPSIVVSFHLTNDPMLYVAVLDEQDDAVYIYQDNNGTFKEIASPVGVNIAGPLPAGADPTGLSFGQIHYPGQATLDALFIGNAFGDILVYISSGGGTFRPLTGETVSLIATAGGAVTLNQSNGDANSYGLTNGGTTLQEVTSLPPGTVIIKGYPSNGVKFYFPNDPIPDVVVANAGSNSVSIYRQLDANGFFYEILQSIAVGTDPVGIASGTLSNDGSVDLAVANEGSNDVSILYGKGEGANWRLTAGPRYAVGSAPTAVAIEDVANREGAQTPDGLPDLVVTTNDGTQLTVLPGIGSANNPSGFFAGLNNGGFNVAVSNAPATPLPQPIPTPAPPPGGVGIVVNPGGDLDLLPPGSLVPQLIFTPPVGLLPTSFAFDATGKFLFVGTDGGGIEVFQEDASGVYSESLATTLTQGDLQDISEMAVVAEDSSHFELYVTNVGEDNPVIVTLQIPVSLPAPPEPAPSPLPTPPAPGAPPVVATLTIELVDHAVNLGSPGGELAVEEVNGVLVATALVSFDEGSPDSGGGDGDVPTDDSSFANGDEVPPLESFVAGLSEQLRALLNEQERGAETRGFDLRSQAEFWSGENVAAGMNDLCESSTGLFEGMRAPTALATGLGSNGTIEAFDWSVLWRPMVGAGQQIGDAVEKSGEDLGKLLPGSLPTAPQSPPPLLDVPLPKPIGTEQMPPEEAGGQGLLPVSPVLQERVDSTVAAAVLADDNEARVDPGSFLSLAVVLGYMFGSTGPFAANEWRSQDRWRLGTPGVRRPKE